KTSASDGYEAVQVTFGRRKLSRVRKPERGHFAKSNIAPGVATREFRRSGERELQLGQAISAADIFKAGDIVDVGRISNGRGHAGVIKRHHFSGFPGSHGTHEYFRHGGSIGNRSYPGRIFKGKRMAGQYGNTRMTALHLRVVEVRPDSHLLLVRGSVPGARRGLVLVRKTG